VREVARQRRDGSHGTESGIEHSEEPEHG
jgi:hypothetical protein